jgi:predicted phage tail protein
MYASNAAPQQYRVLNVQPVSGSNHSLYEITALEFQPDKFAAIEQETAIEVDDPPRYSAPVIVTPPAYALIQVITQSGNFGVGVTFTLDIQWERPILSGVPDPFTNGYLLEWKEVGNAWGNTTTIEAGTRRYAVEVTTGSYQARVAAFSLNGGVSQWVYSNIATPALVNTQAIFNVKTSSMFAEL